MVRGRSETRLSYRDFDEKIVARDRSGNKIFLSFHHLLFEIERFRLSTSAVLLCAGSASEASGASCLMERQIEVTHREDNDCI